MDFLIRWLHMGSASILLGGALFLCVALYASGRRGADRPVLFGLMQAYEWTFWGAAALAVITGAGNLGRFGEALPAPESEWGRELTLKLGLVAVLLALSMVRTLSLVLAEAQEAGASARLQGLYAATALLALTVLGVGVALAHF